MLPQERHALPGSLVIHGKMPPLPFGDLPYDFLATTFLAGAGLGFGAGFGAAFFATAFFAAAFFTTFFAAIMTEASAREAATFESCSAAPVAGEKAEQPSTRARATKEAEHHGCGTTKNSPRWMVGK